MTKDRLHILIINTRPLCYFSAEFFLDRIEENLENLGHRVSRLNLSGDEEDFEILSSFSGDGASCVLDINSKLPYLMDDDGVFWLDKMDVPFFNYILDHPLYHHPGLLFPLKNYHAIGIDKYHCIYMETHYPHLKSVSYLPLAGTEPVYNRDFKEKRDEILFTGTALSDELVVSEVNSIEETFGSSYKRVVLDLLDMWNPNEIPLEECLRTYLNRENKSWDKFLNRPFPELMNILYSVDRIKRDRVRKKVIFELKKSLPITVVGEGWGENSTGMPYANSVELNGRYKYILDINPGFLCGFHDRTANALAAGDVLISNVPTGDFFSGENMISYNDKDLDSLADWFNRINCDEAECIALRGNEYYKSHLTWEKHGEALVNIIREAGL